MMYSRIVKLLKVLLSSVSTEDHRPKLFLKLSNEALGGFSSLGYGVTSVINEADLVVIDSSVTTYDEVLNLLNGLGRDSLALILDLGINIGRFRGLPEELISRGFLKAWLPLDGCALMVSKAGFGRDFIRSTVGIYRDSFIYGPNPIHYNTAYTLYMLSKFVLARLGGVVVEVGTGRGFSTIWLAQAAKEVGSKVVSLDNKCDRVEYAINALKSLGLDNVEINCVDAKKYVREGKDISVLFIDAKKDEYHLYLNNLEKYLLPRALVLAHNTLSSSRDTSKYLEMIYSSNYESITIAIDPAGLTISARSE